MKSTKQMDDDVREGFLCPICMQDLRSFHKLQNHFETSHSAEDKAVLDQIKGLFTKAKGRFLGRDDFQETSASYSSHYAAQAVNATPIWEPQEFGMTRSHMESFKKIRDARIDRVVIESNKVLIRLDKLLCLDEIDQAARREYEKTLVPWVKDGDVPFCPTCGDRFNIRRRRHHCRLCGAIMCSRCSLFVPFDLADQLVQTLKESSFSRRRTRSIATVSDSKLATKQEFLIRCCQECYKVLSKRKNKVEEQVNQPLLVMLYDKLQSAMGSATKYAPEYQQMANSLNQGEEDYDLAFANEMRFKMMKYYETVDVISKKIAALDTNDEENPPRPTALTLQRSIRLTAHAYLQENMLTLPPLPSLPKLEILQKERRKERERKLREQMVVAEQERAEAKRIKELERLTMERSVVERGDSQPKPRNHPSGKVLNEGWSSAGPRRKESLTDGQDVDESDPIMEQIDYVKEMIEQAQRANRNEEVKSLTSNLEELKREYNKKRVAKAFISSNKQNSKNPFLNEQTYSQSANPFLSDESDSGNPFMENGIHSSNSNPFLIEIDSPSQSSDNNPLLQQICYVSKCLDEANKAGRKDEVTMLRQNLLDLQAMYDG